MPDSRKSGTLLSLEQRPCEFLRTSNRSVQPINDGVRMANTTLAAIMGRMAAYTGQEITWDMALNSKESLVPAQLGWKIPVPVPSWAMPGRTKFV